MNKIAPFTRCLECDCKVRLADGHAMKVMKFCFVFIPAFLLCSVVGFMVVGSVPMLNFYLESKGSNEPNFADRFWKCNY